MKINIKISKLVTCCVIVKHEFFLLTKPKRSVQIFFLACLENHIYIFLMKVVTQVFKFKGKAFSWIYELPPSCQLLKARKYTFGK